MGRRLFIVLTILLMFSVSSYATVSITFDDGYQTVFTKAYPIMEKLGIKGTIFITTQNIGKDNYLTKNQIKKLSKNGWEIGSHTKSHPVLPLSNYINQELQASQKILENLINKSISGIASPYGVYNRGVLNKIKKGYYYHRTTQWGINETPVNRYQIKSVIPLQNTPLRKLKKYVKKSKNKLLVLTFHTFDEKINASYSLDKFEKLINYIFRISQTEKLEHYIKEYSQENEFDYQVMFGSCLSALTH